MADGPDPEHVEILSALLPAGGRIALGDGAGLPHELWPAVRELWRRREDAQLLFGWCFAAPDGLDHLDPARARTIVSGFGMRRAIDNGQVGFVPSRLGTVPGLLASRLRTDVLVATVQRVPGGYAFTTEVSWQRAAVAAGATVLAVLRPGAPCCDAQPPLPAGAVRVALESDSPPAELRPGIASAQHHAIAERVAALLPPGARLQVGPGGLGAAVYAAVRVPVAVDTGLVTDPVIDLDRRGLLLEAPVAPYLAGTQELYEWARGRVRVWGVEYTHDPARLVSGRPLVAVNTGIEIDLDGQVNAEVAGGSWAGGVGGQPDYAAAASSSATGLSVFALSSRAGARPTLVEKLSGPVTTPGHDVEIVVTEHGSTDLRGLDRRQRRDALVRLWGADAP